MSRPSVLSNNFHSYQPQLFPDPVLTSLSSVSYRPVQLPLRPPELPAGYNTSHITRTSTVRMSGSAYIPEEDLAHLQKLSNEYEPEVTVSPRDVAPAKSSNAVQRVRWSASASQVAR